MRENESILVFRRDAHDKIKHVLRKCDGFMAEVVILMFYVVATTTSVARVILRSFL